MRIALAVEYAGFAFCGFQSQPRAAACRTRSERAIGEIAGHPVGVVAAGRTDAGVHAASQIVHFDTEAVRPLTAWVRGVNTHLPPAAAVLWAHPVAADFHARFAATARHYTYCSCRTAPSGPACWRGASAGTIIRSTSTAMRAGAAHLAGTHDFSSFRAAECQAKSPVKTLSRARDRAGRSAHPLRFLRQCVSPSHDPQHRRCAARTSARARQPPAWIARTARRARPHARRADVRADGLYFAGADYDARFGLPPTARAVRPCHERRASRSAASRASPTALAASDAGADAIGLMFWSGTPRFVEVGRAREIADALPPFVTKVGLFVDPAAADVRAILDALPLDVLQFHGTETPDLCRAFGRPYLKAIHMKDGVDLLEYAALYEDAAGCVFDSYWPGDLPGGTGRAFDWSRLSAAVQREAAGAGHPVRRTRSPATSARRSAQCSPWAVDVSSGVEERGPDGKARRGIKDAARIAAFIEGVRNADD